MKIKKSTLYIALGILLALGIGLSLFFYLKTDNGASSQKGYLDSSNVMLLPARENVKYSEYPFDSNDNMTIYKVVFESAGVDIYGLLLEPTKNKTYPGVVLLPGAGVSKESELSLAKTIANLGYVVLTIDARGIGETKGVVPTLDEDYARFLEGQIAVQHLFIIDALIAADVLSTREKVDSSRIILMGESFGGRTALIAAAIDDRMKGAIAISSAGVHYSPKEGEDAKRIEFVSSLDADNYVSRISPRPLIMIQNANDKVITVGSAAKTFASAKDPKLFLVVNDTSCNHGYCDSMLSAVNYSLAVFSK